MAKESKKLCRSRDLALIMNAVLFFFNSSKVGNILEKGLALELSNRSKR